MNDADMVLGTDGATGANNATKNYTFSAMKAHFLTNPSVTGNLTVAGNTSIGGTLAVTGTSTFTGEATFNGSINFGDADTDNIFFNADVKSHIIPDQDNTFDLGSSTKQWRNLYVTGTTNLDVVNIEDTLQITGVTAFGVDDTGVDVKFFGATAGRFLHWDESEDHLLFADNVEARFGNDEDMYVVHSGAVGTIENTTGELIIKSASDIVISNPSAEYMRTDISEGYTLFSRPVKIGSWITDDTTFDSDVTLSSSSPQLHLTNTGTAASNWVSFNTSAGRQGFVGQGHTGQQIGLFADNAEVIISSYGATALTLGASQAATFAGNATISGDLVVTGSVNLAGLDLTDNEKLRFGTGNDLEIYHDTNHSYIKEKGDGDLKIQSNNKMEFSIDATPYFDLFDGSINTIRPIVVSSASAHISLPDNAKLQIGTGNDLQIYHDSTHSYIKEAGDGDLRIETTGSVVVKAPNDVAADLELWADNGDNHSDYWKLTAQTDNVFEIQTKDGGSWAPVIELSASDKRTYLKGGLYLPGTIQNNHFTIPNAAGTSGQVLKWPSSGSTLEWSAADSIPHIREGANFSGSLIVGHTTTGSLVNAENNTALGIGALDAITSGDFNVALGWNAGTALTNTHFNVLIGAKAGTAITTGLSNIAIGYGALEFEDEHGHNVAIGHKALNKLNAGVSALNVAIGFEAGKTLVTGVKNTLIGTHAGTAMSTYYENVIIGESAGESLTGTANGAEHTGSKNVIIGCEAFDSHTTGANNVIVGHGAMTAMGSSSSNNVVIGGYAGSSMSGGSNSNTIIGWGADVGSGGDDNSIAIGKQAEGHGSHIAVIGNTDITAWHPADDNGVDLGSTSYSFKDSYVQGRSNAGNFKIDALNTAPSSASDTGTLGEIRYTTDYIYICIATDTWKRSAIATW
jgi:hypothetical protein